MYKKKDWIKVVFYKIYLYTRFSDLVKIEFFWHLLVFYFMLYDILPAVKYISRKAESVLASN